MDAIIIPLVLILGGGFVLYKQIVSYYEKNTPFNNLTEKEKEEFLRELNKIKN